MGRSNIDMAQREPKRLECKECDYTTRSHDSLSKHNTEKHYPDLFQPCQYCHFVSTDAKKVRTHVAQVHVRRGKYNCKQCDYIGKGYVGKSQRCLERHIAAEHHSGLTAFKTDTSTEIKLESEDSDSSVDDKCRKCNFPTPNLRTCHEHAKRQHFDCEDCDFSTVFRLRLSAHEKTCGGTKESGYLFIEGVDKPYHCPHCGFDAATKKFVLRHMDRCSKEKGKNGTSSKEKGKDNTKCDEGDFMASEPEEDNPRVAKAKSATTAKIGIKSSLARRPFKCPKCKLSFSDKGEAMLHSRKRHIKCVDVNCAFVTTHMDISLVHMRDCLKARGARKASPTGNRKTREELKDPDWDPDCEILVIEEKRPKEKLRAPARGDVQVNWSAAPEVTMMGKDPWESMWERRFTDPDPEATLRMAEQQRVRNMAGFDFFRKMQEEFAKKKEREQERKKKEEEVMKNARDANGRESDSGNETKETISDNDEEMMQEDPAPDNAAAPGGRGDKEENDGADGESAEGGSVEGTDPVAAALVEVGLLEPIVSMQVGEELSVSVPDGAEGIAEKKATMTAEDPDSEPRRKRKKRKGLPPFFRAFLRGKAEKEEPVAREGGDSIKEEEEENGEGEKAPCDLCPFVAGDQNGLTSHILKMHVVV